MRSVLGLVMLSFAAAGEEPARSSIVVREDQDPVCVKARAELEAQGRFRRGSAGIAYGRAFDVKGRGLQVVVNDSDLVAFEPIAFASADGLFAAPLEGQVKNAVTVGAAGFEQVSRTIGTGAVCLEARLATEPVDAGVSGTVQLGSVSWEMPQVSEPRTEVLEDGPFGPGTETWLSLRHGSVTWNLSRFVGKRRVKWPATTAAVLAAWQRFHGCTAKAFTPRSTLPEGPQAAFRGTCKAPEEFLTRMLLRPDGLYTLNVTHPIFGGGERVELETELDTFARSLTWR